MSSNTALLDTILFSEGDFKNYDYIVKHKRNLLKAFNMCLTCILLCEDEKLEYSVDFKVLKDRVLTHDLDKFKPEIFYPYSKKYFDESDSEDEKYNYESSPLPDHVLAALDLDSYKDLKDDFEKAWELHYFNNRHHPEYYKENGGKMEDIDIFEMAIDFTAMSLKFGGQPYDYYQKKKPKLEKEFGDIINYDLLSALTKMISKSYKFRIPRKID